MLHTLSFVVKGLRKLPYHIILTLSFRNRTLTKSENALFKKIAQVDIAQEQELKNYGTSSTLSLRKESEHPAARQEKQGTLALKCFLGPKSSSHLLYKSFDLGNTETGFNDVMPINTFKRSNPIWKKTFTKTLGNAPSHAHPCIRGRTGFTTAGRFGVIAR